MNSKIVLFIGYEKKPTELQDGDTLAVFSRAGTVGFLRGGCPLVNKKGDDKFIAHGACVQEVLHHLDIYPDLVSDIDGIRLYRLHVHKSESD